ncbi:hypothetical protein NRIC_22370 [Enterococcus florum]|uniref:PucR C-terminal helix-turn-helix domain-containing protein n=1 Tax=Enterococcus florum TaxID=2480627 RepID=A0A4P5P9S5_9ENTE|nr:PucR family transcriptional regulator [Enterococcus florum]GCF94346.1 hypothetical protein NRIC_22370 [Enterococcus florum]
MDRYTESNLIDYTNQMIDQIAQGCTIEELAARTYQTFELPIIVADPGYRFIAYAGDEEVVDPYWRQIIYSGEPTDHTIMEYYINDGLMTAITGSKEALHIDWGVCEDYPQTCGPIYIDQNLEGFASVLFLDKAILEFSLRLNNLLCRFCAILMRSKNFRLKHAINPVKELLAQKLFDTVNYPTSASLEEYLSTVQVKANYCLCVLSEKNRDQTILSHVKSRIVKGRSDILYLVKDQKLYLLLHQLKQQALEKTFLELVAQYGLYCGSSGLFSSLSKRDLYIQRAELAHEAARSLDQSGRCLDFADSYSETLMLQPIGRISSENLMTAPLQALLHYDQQHEAELAKTLEAYLFQRNDINKTSNTLHIHRNTLIYRLNKIRDLTMVEIDDPKAAWQLQLMFWAAAIKRQTEN